MRGLTPRTQGDFSRCSYRPGSLINQSRYDDQVVYNSRYLSSWIRSGTESAEAPLRQGARLRRARRVRRKERNEAGVDAAAFECDRICELRCQLRGDVAQWESACLASRRSAVRIRSSPPSFSANISAFAVEWQSHPGGGQGRHETLPVQMASNTIIGMKGR
jgi:hypothetical protein